MIVYGRSNGKALRSALNSMTEVRNGYIYAAATGKRIAKIGNTIMMSLRYVHDQKQPEKDTTAWIVQATGRIVCWFDNSEVF